MAHFIGPPSASRLVSVNVGVGQTVELSLWGGGPDGDDLEVRPNNQSVLSVIPTQGSSGPNLRGFQLNGLKQGSAVLEARRAGGGPVWASIQVTVGSVSNATVDLFYYHGTKLDQATKLMAMDIGVMDVASGQTLDWWEYTDFGKGFYTHPHETRKLAVVWAKRKGKEWGVVRFGFTKQEFDAITGTPLYFQNKSSRPANAPVFTPLHPASWLEFVEYNRGIGTSIQRPKDKDWSNRYPWIRGPIWAKQDSNLGLSDIGILLPDHIHQINWGAAGLAIFNTDAAKSQRFLFTKDNERLLEEGQLVGSGYSGGGGRSGGGGASGSY